MATLPGGSHASEADGARYELAGPETLTHRQIVEVALRSFGDGGRSSACRWR
jgi:hypothetical protein